MFDAGTARHKLWLIFRYEGCRRDVLTVEDGDGGGRLPVFSFEEEADLFARFEETGPGWRAMESTPGEVASVLCGPCSGVKEVALDPPPRICGDGLIRLVSLARETFLETLLGEKKGPSPRLGVPREGRPPLFVHHDRMAEDELSLSTGATK